MRIAMFEIQGQKLRVGIREGSTDRPPLLMFNGIGANLELAEPFMNALEDTGAVIFIGGIGLLAFMAGIAAFRRTVTAAQSTDGAALIGGVLVLLGLIFIGVAGWNLARNRNNQSAV